MAALEAEVARVVALVAASVVIEEAGAAHEAVAVEDLADVVPLVVAVVPPEAVVAVAAEAGEVPKAVLWAERR